MNTIIEIAKSGLNRFYDEGYTSWSEEKLRTVFGNHRLEEAQIMEALEKWQNAGWIVLSRNKREYLRMLEIISD